MGLSMGTCESVRKHLRTALILVFCAPAAASLIFAQGQRAATKGLAETFLPVAKRSVREAVAANRAPKSPFRVGIDEAYGRLPLTFERNEGQADARVKFLSRGRGYSLFLTKAQAMLVLARGPRHAAPQSAALQPLSASNPLTAAGDNGKPTAGVVSLRLAGANPHTKVLGLEELRAKSNYFLGNDPGKWRTDVPNYARVIYQNVYPGIDLVFYGHQGQLEFDWVVRPGADPKLIHLIVQTGFGTSADVVALSGNGEPSPHKNPSRVRVTADGDLVISTAAGDLRFRKPLVYQTAAGDAPSSHRQLLEGRFVLGPAEPAPAESGVRASAYQVGFEVASYDPSKPLVIDPVLSYSTYLGGTSDDQINAIALDGSGMAYVAGWTVSTDFPAAGTPYQAACNNCTSSPNFWDVFVAKFDPTQSGAASLVYSTYLGGSDQDSAQGIAVDSGGNAYLTGLTLSSDFPVTAANAFQSGYGGGGDAFLAKIGPAGSTLPYSTYLGGAAQDQGLGIALRTADQPYITGSTASPAFPTTGGAFQPTRPSTGGATDAFVSKFDTTASGSASLTYSTYLGGTNGNDQGNAIALDTSGDALVAGQTSSDDFPTTAGAFDLTCGTDGLCDAGSYSDAFVVKLNPAGSGASDLLYSTYLGGGSADNATAIAVDGSDNVYVTGLTESPNFPTTSGALQVLPSSSSGFDAFVAKLIPNAALTPASSQLVYATYLGGTGFDQGNAIAVDAFGEAYVAGATGSPDFPMASPVQAQCPNCPGAVDGFVSKLNAAGSALIFSTYLDGSSEDRATALALDVSGNAYVGGFTSSTDFPVSAGAYQSANAGTSDGFFLTLSNLNLPVTRLAPGSLSFPDTNVAATSGALSVTLSNLGDADLTLTTSVSNPNSVSTTGDFAVASGTTCTNGLTIVPGSSCVVMVTFTPTFSGDRTGVLSIQDDAYGNPQTVSLKGKGLSQAVAGLSANSLSFGDQRTGATSLSQTVTLSNTGSGPLDIAGVVTSLSDYVQTNNCGTVVPGGSSCDIHVGFAPASSGTVIGTLTINDDGPGSPHTVGLSGTGISVFLPTSSLTFGDQILATNSAAQSVSLSNTGVTAVTITSITASGDFSQTSNCPLAPSTLAPSASCSISVVFSPTVTGSRLGGLHIFDQTDGTAQTVSLSGTGVAPAVTLGPASLDFGNLLVNTTSTALTSTLTNTGTAALTISSIGASGDFSQTNNCPISPATLAINSSCTLTLTFTPSLTGVRRGAVTISDNAPSSPQTLGLTGTGTSPDVTLAPGNLNFNPQGVGTTSAAQTVALTNSGAAAMTISSIIATGDYSQTNDCPVAPATLGAGDSCTLTAKFTPTTTGPRLGSVTVTDNAPGSPHVLALSGTGVAAYALTATATSNAILKNVDSTTFTISASTNYNFSGSINLSCSGNSPAQCVFSRASITPGQTSTLTVSGLSAFTTSFLVFTVRGVSGNQTASLDLTVLISYFSMSGSPSSGTVTAGQSASYDIAVAPTNGYNQPVSLSCSGAPAAASCSVSPSSVSLDGTNAVTAKLTLTTTARGMVPPGPATPPFPFHPTGWLLALLLVILMAAVLAARRKLRPQYALALTLACVLTWAACGGGGTTSSTPTPTTGTPSGLYTITVVGTSGNLSNRTTVTLKVD